MGSHSSNSSINKADSDSSTVGVGSIVSLRLVVALLGHSTDFLANLFRILIVVVRLGYIDLTREFGLHNCHRHLTPVRVAHRLEFWRLSGTDLVDLRSRFYRLSPSKVAESA